MRMTLTIEESIIRELKELAQYRGNPLRAVINETLRQGLRKLREPSAPKRYKSPVFSLGHPPMVNLDKALSIASALEDDEISKELSACK